MCKNAIITTLCCCFILFAHWTTRAQTRIIDLDNAGTDPIHYPLDDDLNAIFTTPTVRVANLQAIVRSASGQLPPGTEPIFLKFAIPNYYETLIPVEHFTFWQYINGYPVYKMIPEDFVVNFSDLCNNSMGGKTTFEYRYTLVTEDGELYPIHDSQYSNPNGIFSCEVFYLTCPDCSTNKGCQVVPDPVFGAPLSGISQNSGDNDINNDYPISRNWGAVDCPSPFYISQANNPSSGWQALPTPPSSKTGLTDLEVKLAPNPFDQQIQLNYRLAQEDFVQITIFNAQGQVMYQNQAQRGANAHDQIFDTSQWTNGIYYCRIQTTDHSQVVKIVKAR
ncbi:MAG: T9SS type A sorting domain-containing protein [Bacteroidota bacterium]